MHTKQAISVCCLANRFHLHHVLDADIHKGKKNIKALRGDLFSKIVNTVFLTLCLFFAYPQALINL